MVKPIFNKIFLIGLILLLFIGSLPDGANAQSYSFQLTDEVVHYFIKEDGTVSVEYYFTFKNDPGASPIDFVDVGMPNSNFNLANVSADVNGVSVNVSSDYQGDGSSGFAVELGSQAISDMGVVHVKVDGISGMMYQDNDKNDYASTEFSPTWFGSSYVYGTTVLTVIFHFPVGVLPEESIYHLPSGEWNGPQEPSRVDTQTGVAYTWFDPSANGFTQYKFGVSFPKKYIPDGTINEFGWIEALIGAVIGILPCLVPLGLFILFFGVLPYQAIQQAKKRKLEYIKPTISAEGQGIKRGLTAVEAAILLGVPLDKILSMILFGVTKKGAMEVLREKPLQVKKAEVMPTGLTVYESDFIESMVSDLAIRKTSLQKMFVALVRSVNEKMKGFSKKDSVAYYESIIEKAWTQVTEAKTPDLTPILNEKSLEWTMADRDFSDRSRRTFTGPVIVPQWYGHYNPTAAGSGTSVPTTSIPSAGAGKVQLPGADFAASMVDGVQNFSGQLVGNINDFTGKVTDITNPVSAVASTGRRSGGGGSCACACACAGCACACAGGGR